MKNAVCVAKEFHIFFLNRLFALIMQMSPIPFIIAMTVNAFEDTVIGIPEIMPVPFSQFTVVNKSPRSLAEKKVLQVRPRMSRDFVDVRPDGGNTHFHSHFPLSLPGKKSFYSFVFPHPSGPSKGI